MHGLNRFFLGRYGGMGQTLDQMECVKHNDVLYTAPDKTNFIIIIKLLLVKE